MRCALAEFMISKALVEHIFVDVLVPQDAHLQKAIADVCSSLELACSEREGFVRCQLLCGFEETEDIRLLAINVAIGDVSATLDFLLPSGPTRQEFIAKLKDLFQEAMALWEPFRKSKQRISVEWRLEEQDLKPEEDFYADYGGQQNVAETKPIIPLFPEVIVGDTVVFPAKVLWSSQLAVVQAAAELEQGARNGRAEGLARTMHRRRHSVKAPAQTQLGRGSSEADARPGNGQSSAPSVNATRAGGSVGK